VNKNLPMAMGRLSLGYLSTAGGDAGAGSESVRASGGSSTVV